MQRISGFLDCNLVLPQGVKKDSLSILNGRIETFDAPLGAMQLPDGLFVAPGFLDEHIHGTAGKDVMDGVAKSLAAISCALPPEGVTSFLATTMSESIPAIEKALLNVAENQNQVRGAKIAGIHLEGPFLSPDYLGAQSKEFLLPPDPRLLSHWQALAKGLIRELTFAYELPGGKALLKEALHLGITPSLGHSGCHMEEAREAFANGIHCVTHLFNGQRGIHHRDLGVAGEALLTPGVNVEVIADLRHVCLDALRLVFATKSKEEVLLISDSTEAKYLPKKAKAKLGHQEIFVDDGVAKLQDGRIAGSVLPLNQALKNVSSIAKGYSFSDLINLVSLNPARNNGLEKEIGSIEMGKRADLVILNKDFDVFATIIDGGLVYQKEGFRF